MLSVRSFITFFHFFLKWNQRKWKVVESGSVWLLFRFFVTSWSRCVHGFNPDLHSLGTVQRRESKGWGGGDYMCLHSHQHKQKRSDSRVTGGSTVRRLGVMRQSRGGDTEDVDGHGQREGSTASETTQPESREGTGIEALHPNPPCPECITSLNSGPEKRICRLYKYMYA